VSAESTSPTVSPSESPPEASTDDEEDSGVNGAIVGGIVGGVAGVGIIGGMVWYVQKFGWPIGRTTGYRSLTVPFM